MHQQGFFLHGRARDRRSQGRITRLVMSGLAACFLALLLNAQQPGAPRKSETLSAAALAQFRSLEPIDTHAHVFQTGPEFTAMLDRLHMHLLDILVVDDTVPAKAGLEPQRTDALKFVDSNPNHARLCTSFDPFQFNKPGFAKAAIEGLNRDFERGAIAVKIWKNVGMELKDEKGRYVLPDDPRLEPIYQDIAAHHKTLVAHLAEPDVAWGPNDDPKAPYSGYYRKNPQWDMSKKPGTPPKSAILAARDHMLAMNPNLRVVGAHLGSMEGSLDEIARHFDRYPNFAVDVAARMQSLMLQPGDKVRAFLIKYQDRIVYGTDLGFAAGTTAPAAARTWETRYAQDWRYFSTGDRFEAAGIETQGLNLPRPILKKIYHDNAVRWIPGIVGNSR